jgi:cell wall-associated NlpC family hydrolase
VKPARIAILGGGAVLSLALVAPFSVLLLAAGSTTGACGAPSAAVGVEAVNVRAVAGLTPEQLHNAGTVIAVGQSMGVDQRGVTIGVMTAIDESGLVNIDVGDAAGPDSRGLFQQRATGWGSYQDRMDPAIASRSFYSALQKVPGWEAMSPTAAAHTVQRNADPNAYSRYFAEAEQIVSNATGQPAEAAAAVTCAAEPGQVAAAPTAAAATAVAWAMARRGTPYLFGGSGPVGPWDCSGFTQAAYAAAGVSLARDTYGQALDGVAVSRDQVQPGDLWLPEMGHIELAISPTEAVESPHTGDVVKVSPIGQVGIFRRVAQ